MTRTSGSVLSVRLDFSISWYGGVLHLTLKDVWKTDSLFGYGFMKTEQSTAAIETKSDHLC